MLIVSSSSFKFISRLLIGGLVYAWESNIQSIELEEDDKSGELRMLGGFYSFWYASSYSRIIIM